MSEGNHEGQPYQPPQQPGFQPPPQQPGYQQPPPQPGYQQPPQQQPGQQPPPQQPGFQPPPQQPGYQQPQQQPGQQQPYAQQPYYQPPPGSGAPPAKKKRSGLVILGIIFGVMVLGIGACSAAVFFAAKGPIDKTNEFLTALQVQDYDTAFELTEPACQVASGPAELGQFFAGVAITDFDIKGVSNVNGQVSTSGSITFDGNDQRTIELELQNDRICFFDISAP